MPRGAWPQAQELSLAPWPRHGVRRVPAANPVAGGVGDHAIKLTLDRLPKSLRHERMLPAHGTGETSVRGSEPM